MESEDKSRRGYGRASPNSQEPSSSTGKRKTSESDGRSSDIAKKSAPERREMRHKNKFISIIRTRPHMLERESTYDSSMKVSQGVERIQLEVNYIREKKQISGWNIHQYRVNIEPQVILPGKRRFLVGQHKDKLKSYLFDGEQLFSNHRIHTEGEILELQSLDPNDNQMYTVQLKFTNIVQPNHERCLQIYNLIIRKIESGLKMQLVGRNFYDPGNMIDFREHRLQLWPGYETSTRQFTGGLLLNIDVSHKVMRTDVVYDMMKEIYRKDRDNFENNFKHQIIGQTVLTAYNNKTYRIDDVDFEKTAGSTFKRKDDEISYVQYYAERYQLEIRDAGQPLLVVNLKDRDRRGGQNSLVNLIPELCRFTGYDDRQRNDMRVKNALKPYTQMNPRTRRERLLKFIQRIYATPRCTEVLNEWNLELEKNLVRVPAFKLPGRRMHFGANRDRVVSAGWDDAFRGDTILYETVDLNRLAVVYPRILGNETNQFLQKLVELSRKMGFNIKPPRKYDVSNENDMLAKFEELSKNAQVVLFVTSQDNRKNGVWYGGIKKISATQGIPTQVVTRRVLQSSGGRLASIATKIAIQINCKLGGLPWMPNIPMRSVMTVGFEIAKDSCNQKRYGCLVATMDLKAPTRPDPSERQTRFFSKVEEINGPDCSLQLTSSMMTALDEYVKEHYNLPDRIIFYRGGAGEGDLPYIKETEVSILKERLQRRYEVDQRDLKLTYMVVTKKINTRFFLANSDRHIDPGTVVDNVITLDERYEFFMVSQQINQGTATPTNYNVVYESEEFAMTPEKLQMWTWIQTHLYYNWCGTTRQPAVLQYANKLGFLVSNYMHRTPENYMNNQLYFL